MGFTKRTWTELVQSRHPAVSAETQGLEGFGSHRRCRRGSGPRYRPLSASLHGRPAELRSQNDVQQGQRDRKSTLSALVKWGALQAGQARGFLKD